MKKLEASLATSRKRLTLLVEKRSTAKGSLDAAQAQRLKYLHEGDLADEKLGEKLQIKVDAALSVLAGYDDAISALQQQIESAQREFDVERERQIRAKAADEISCGIDAVAPRVETALSAMRALAQSLSDIDHVSFEIGQLAQYIRGAAGEAELASSVALPGARHIARAVKAGEMAVPRRPQAGSIAPAEPPPPTMTIFMLRSARYRDHDDRKRFAGQWEDATMPVATAQRALGKGIAVPLTDPRRATHRGMRGGDFTPEAADVVDLDAMPLVEANPVLRAAGFTVIDRSAETRKGEITVTRF